MKLASIALKGFRIYRDAEVTFEEPLSIIRGANHAGKTTLKQAIELTVTRRADGTTASGGGADDKIRQGEKRAQVDLKFETQRGPVDAGMILKPTGRTYSGPQAFRDYLDANAVRWSCVLDPEYFIEQNEKDQKAILSALIAPSEYEFDPQMAPLIEKHIGTILEELTTPIEQIEWCYSRAFKLRTEAKAKLDAIHIPQPTKAPDYTVQAIQQYLDKLRDELAAEAQPAPQSDVPARIARLEEQLRQKERDLQAQQENLSSARDRIRDAESNMLTGPQMTKHKATADKRATFVSIEKDSAKLRAQIANLERDIAVVKEVAGEGSCPTCQRELTPEIRDEVVQNLESVIRSIRLTIESNEKEQKKLGDIDAAERALADHERAKQSKLDWVKRQTAANEELTRIGKEIVSLNEQLTVLRNQSVAEATPAKDLSDVKAKIEAWERKLLEANTYETVQRQIEQATERQAEMKQTVADLERLCAYFGKDGVKADIIKASIEGFTDQVNQVLGTWGYSCELSVEPYRFLVTTADSKVLPLKELSGSERLMFGVALQSAIAIQSGIGLMVIDRADTFINGERGRLFQVVKSLLDDGLLEQAIVLVSDERTEVPDQPGVAFYRTGDGKVERLGQSRNEQQTAA